MEGEEWIYYNIADNRISMRSNSFAILCYPSIIFSVLYLNIFLKEFATELEY